MLKPHRIHLILILSSALLPCQADADFFRSADEVLYLAENQANTMSVKNAYNFRQASELVATAGIINEQQLMSLAPEGYKAVISLLPDDSEYAIKNEQEIVESQGLDYRYIPVDFSAPTTGNYATFVTAMEEFKGEKIIIHCAANFRVSAFFSIYAHHNFGWSLQKVDEFMASLWKPAEFPAWQSFIDDQLANGSD